jgi:hypothetical protein
MADYKNTEGFLRLKQELMAFEALSMADTVYTEEIISKYKLYYSYPIYSNIDMPTGLIGQTLDSFERLTPSHDLILELIKKNPWKWYLLTGKSGIGKTHLAVGAMIASMGGNKKRGLYKTGAEIFQKIKEHKGCEHLAVDLYSDVDILIIDECEMEKIPAFKDEDVKGYFMEIIRRRDVSKKQTIVIGNNPEEVRKIIGSNGYSRFEGRGEILNLTSDAWQDQRPNKKVELNKDGNTPF